MTGFEVLLGLSVVALDVRRSVEEVGEIHIGGRVDEEVLRSMTLRTSTRPLLPPSLLFLDHHHPGARCKERRALSTASSPKTLRLCCCSTRGGIRLDRPRQRWW